MSDALDPDALPRAIALRYDQGEIVFGAGAAPVLERYSYTGCGLRVFGKSPTFLDRPAFRRAAALARACMGRKASGIDDNRWILHTVLWAAAQAARLPGDFVECGVDTGMFSAAICEYLDFNTQDRDFWLFDTFAGIPEAQMTAAEQAGIGGWHNRHSYEECFTVAQANFAPWPRCRLVRGEVPATLAQFPPDRRIAYLSIDMNIVAPEIAALEFFWDRLVPGGIVLLDDYGWATHRAQQAAMDDFAAARAVEILCLPTGQGLLIR
ncbi:MAG: class I SAM-dependent methyltransferase [Rhodospirillales bacterium]|nr:class I SAM-dependent methyltransferase [Rhodospirillales bacterium]